MPRFRTTYSSTDYSNRLFRKRIAAGQLSDKRSAEFIFFVYWRKIHLSFLLCGRTPYTPFLRIVSLENMARFRTTYRSTGYSTRLFRKQVHRHGFYERFEDCDSTFAFHDVAVCGCFVWLRQIHPEPTGGLPCKSAVYGLNGHRLYYIISLFKVTYKSTIQVSRNFHALFTKTLENSDTCD